jgi:hypothetical protein
MFINRQEERELSARIPKEDSIAALPLHKLTHTIIFNRGSLKSLSGINKFSCLWRLDLGRLGLISIQGIESCQRLGYLSLANNALSLRSVQEVLYNTQVMSLCLVNNRFNSIHETTRGNLVNTLKHVWSLGQSNTIKAFNMLS